MNGRSRHFVAAAVLVPYLASAAAGSDALQGVAKRLAKGVDQLKPKRIAVLTFPYHNGDVSSGSSIVSERLTTLMVERGGVEVVERTLLEKTMGEIRLGLTGMLDPATTQKLGKVLGVKAVVTGTLIDLEDKQTEVNARIIETETGEILAAATAKIQRSWDDLPRPAPAAPQASSDEVKGSLHMSQLIPVHSVRRRMPPPVYTGPMEPSSALVSGESSLDVLTLTNDDLVPVNHRGQTDPERVVDDFLSENQPPAPESVHIARRIYHRNPSPQVRGRALLAMGHLLERSGRPGQAAQAYNQILREFPDSPALQTQARQQLSQIALNEP
jgi:hypothetical protein